MTPVSHVHDGSAAQDDPSELFERRRPRSGPYAEVPSSALVSTGARQQVPLPQAPPSYQQQPQQVINDKYTRLVKTDISSTIMGVPKHVFKVKEVTKFLLFVGMAAGSILLIDVSAKFLIAMSNKNKQ
jgi:hypothetical protein